MISKEEVKKLSVLARLAVSDDELESVAREIGAILEYVGSINTAVEGMTSVPLIYNNLREDTEINETGKESETLLASAPRREGNFVKVKKVL